MFLEKVYDSFPWTCGKPLAARANSFDDGKRSVQRYLVSFVTTQYTSAGRSTADQGPFVIR
jgi:hypothetical protein